jgi:Protein kinase domain
VQHGAPPRLGDTLGRFLLERELGRGRSGVVFLAVDTLSRQTVALKVLASMSGTDAPGRVHREVSAARRLAHKGLRPVFDVHEVGGRVLIAMEPVQGASIKNLLARGGRLPASRVLPWLFTVADALTAAHRAGIVHGALTLGDVLVRPTGEACVLGIGDTSAYMAACTGAPIGATEDIRAVVAILVEALTGRALPAPGSPPPLLSVLLPSAPRALDEIVRRATAPDDPRAFREMRELGGELREIVTAMGLRVPTTADPAPVALPAFVPLTQPSAQSLASASTRLREELPQEPTLPLSEVPALHPELSLADVDQAVAEDSASWVVAGQAVNLPARPKAMQVVTEVVTEPVRRAARPKRSRLPAAAAVLLLVVTATAGVLALLRHEGLLVLDTHPSADAGMAGEPQKVPGPLGPMAPAQPSAGADAGPSPVAVPALDVDGVRNAARAAIAAKGLLSGDDVEVDRLSERIEKPADLEDATDALKTLEARLQGLVVDKKLVTKKLGRLRVEARAVASAPKRRALERALDDAAKLLTRDRAIDANAKLNEAFAAEGGAGSR